MKSNRLIQLRGWRTLCGTLQMLLAEATCSTSGEAAGMVDSSFGECNAWDSKNGLFHIFDSIIPSIPPVRRLRYARPPKVFLHQTFYQEVESRRERHHIYLHHLTIVLVTYLWFYLKLVAWLTCLPVLSIFLVEWLILRVKDINLFIS